MSAMDDLQQVVLGYDLPDLTKLASLGTHGLNEQNTYRDLRTNLATPLFELFNLFIPIKDSSVRGFKMVALPLILPHVVLPRETCNNQCSINSGDCGSAM